MITTASHSNTIANTLAPLPWRAPADGHHCTGSSPNSSSSSSSSRTHTRAEPEGTGDGQPGDGTSCACGLS